MSGLRLGSLFSGAAGLDMAVESVLGTTTAWHAEIDPAASKVLAHRFPDVPNLGDLTAVDWSTVEPVDVICGGSPCQDVSHAGKRAGMRAGTRSGLWASMCDAIEILRPRLVVWENVRGVLSAEADSALEPCAGCVGDDTDGPVLRALGRVLGDLADLGYDASWHGLRAADVGAPHGRFRVFVVATDAERVGLDRWASDTGRGAAGRVAANPHRDGLQGVGRLESFGRDADGRGCADESGNGTERAVSAADARGERLGQHPGEPSTEEAGTVSGDVVAGDRGLRADTDWGPYRPAIERWEHVLDRRAPAPTEAGTRGSQRLSPRFVEWMMGWPAGWVTDVPGITRNDALRICGNGVVPQQAAEALRRLLSLERVAA